MKLISVPGFTVDSAEIQAVAPPGLERRIVTLKGSNTVPLPIVAADEVERQWIAAVAETSFSRVKWRDGDKWVFGRALDWTRDPPTSGRRTAIVANEETGRLDDVPIYQLYVDDLCTLTAEARLGP